MCTRAYDTERFLCVHEHVCVQGWSKNLAFYRTALSCVCPCICACIFECEFSYGFRLESGFESQLDSDSKSASIFS